MLFQRFDRLLFLAKGGRTIYFGDIGENSETLTNYFVKNGSDPCPKGDNPAEWMLEVIGAAPGSHTEIDWHQTWRQSPEYQEVQTELQRLKVEGSAHNEPHDKNSESYREFAAPFWEQLRIASLRVFQQYWRTPSYIYSKAALCIQVGLFIGLVFLNAPLSIQGLQNQMFAIFQVLTVFGQLVQMQVSPPHSPYVQHSLTSLDASLRHPTLSLRSPRTPLQDLQLESLHALPSLRRDPLEQSHVRLHVRLHLLPSRLPEERRSSWPDCRARCSHVASLLAVPRLHVYLCPHVYRHHRHC